MSKDKTGQQYGAYIVVAVLVLLIVGAGYFWVQRNSEDALFAKKFEQVDGQMTYDDVINLFGRTMNASGVLKIDPVDDEEAYVENPSDAAASGVTWQFDEGRENYIIWFSEDNQVIYKAHVEMKQGQHYDTRS